MRNIFHVIAALLLTTYCIKIVASDGKGKSVEPTFCEVFDLVQLPDAQPILEEIVEVALTDTDWDKKKGKDSGQKGNIFVNKILSKSVALKKLLSPCNPRVKFDRAEKTLVGPLKKAHVSSKIKALGKPSDIVPIDAQIFLIPLNAADGEE